MALPAELLSGDAIHDDAWIASLRDLLIRRAIARETPPITPQGETDLREVLAFVTNLVAIGQPSTCTTIAWENLRGTLGRVTARVQAPPSVPAAPSAGARGLSTGQAIALGAAGALLLAGWWAHTQKRER